jgi:hypothetical protein
MLIKYNFKKYKIHDLKCFLYGQSNISCWTDQTVSSAGISYEVNALQDHQMKFLSLLSILDA